jgi:feruloyl esterase
MALFAWSRSVQPAAATPCTNLAGLQLTHTTIRRRRTTTPGSSSSPTTPPTTLTGLPAFCRVTATLTPTSDSAIRIEAWLPKTTWNNRFLGTGGGGFQGTISYSALALGIQQGFAATNSDLGTGSSGCNPLFCGSAGNMGNPLAIAFGDPHRPRRPVRTSGADRDSATGDPPDDGAQQGDRQGLLSAARRRLFAGCSTGGQNA